jgi:hypothetical protein
MISIAIKQNLNAIQFVENPTNEMKWFAINKDIQSIRYFKEITEEMDILYRLNIGGCTKYNDKYLAIIKKQLSII